MVRSSLFECFPARQEPQRGRHSSARATSHPCAGPAPAIVS